MKLNNLNFDVLETLPYRQKHFSTLDNKLRENNRHLYKKYYHNVWKTDKVRKIQHVFNNSIGKHVNNIHSKLTEIWPNNFYYYTPLSFIQSKIFKDERDLNYSIHYENVYNKRRSYGYFIDSGGILCYERYQYKRYRATGSCDYSKLKKERKERRNIEINTLLKLINNKPLYEFYCKLIKISSIFKDKNGKIIDSGYRYWIEYKRNNWDQYTERYYLSNNEVLNYKNDIEQIESGNYNVFFKSNVYLYSLQKECHHFETP